MKGRRVACEIRVGHRLLIVQKFPEDGTLLLKHVGVGT